jgi:hypothetical protein
MKARSMTRTDRRGAIFLADDEDVAYIIQRPFFLLPAPPRRFKMAQSEYKDDPATDVENGGRGCEKV